MRKILCAGLIGLASAAMAAGQFLPPRYSFDIVTGAAAGSHFPTGEAIARVVSHPPGLARCERSPLCGPPGVIVSARSSEGVVANVLAVNDGTAASGLAEAAVVAAAIAGKGEFAKSGPQTHIKVMADLYGEQLQLVVRGSKIRSVADLKGRRVSVGVPGSGTALVAQRVLAAFKVRRVTRVFEATEASGGLLRQGKLDAFFVLRPAPVPFVADMVGRDQARLLPIDGRPRKALLASGLDAAVIPAGVNSPRIVTVGSPVLWIVSDRASAGTVYGLVRALYHPGNSTLLATDAAAPIRLPPASELQGLPLHPGAVRYYREIGALK
jgi:TRAP transporter TAXI family solute receptor